MFTLALVDIEPAVLDIDGHLLELLDSGLNAHGVVSTLFQDDIDGSAQVHLVEGLHLGHLSHLMHLGGRVVLVSVTY